MNISRKRQARKHLLGELGERSWKSFKRKNKYNKLHGKSYYEFNWDVMRYGKVIREEIS